MRKTSFLLSVLVLLTMSMLPQLASAQDKDDMKKMKKDDMKMSSMGEMQKDMVISGTLVDLKCYSSGGYLTNDHGGMKDCGTMCAKAGLPVGLVEANKTVHILGVPAADYADLVGKELRLTGMNGKYADVFIPTKMEIKENGKWMEKKLPKDMM